MKNLFNSLLAMASVCLLSLAGCQKPEAETPGPQKNLEVAISNDTAAGEGDSFTLTITSNVAWEISVVDADGLPVDWVVFFDETTGEGNAEVFATVKRGDRTDVRTCTIAVSEKDGTLKKTVTLTQGKFTVEMYSMTLKDVIDAGAVLEVGASDNLTDYGQFHAEVVAVPGANLPEGYIYVADAKNFLRVKTSQASEVAVGDKLLLEMTDGTVTKDAEGVYTADLPAELAVEQSGAPTVEPLFISADAIGRYGNALVAVGYCQTKEDGAAWSGDVAMTTKIIPGGSEFTVHIAEGASLSGSANSGQVVGIVVDGKLRPRTAADIQLTEERKSEVEEYTIQSIGNYFKYGAVNSFSNVTVSNKRKLTFTDAAGYSVAGASVEKLEGSDDLTNLSMVVAANTPYQTCFVTKGWATQGSALLFTIPVNQPIYGNLEFAFSVSTAFPAIFPGDWKVQWSKDNTVWNDMSAVYCTNQTNADTAAGNTFTLTRDNHQANRQVAEFYIPKAEAITNGNIYFKVTPPTAKDNVTTLRVNVGFTLNSKNLSPADNGFDNVLAMENFESSVFGHNTVIGIPVYYMMNHAFGPDYVNADGWTADHNGAAVLYRGCLHLSGTSKCYMKSPALGLESPTDVYLSFKVAPSWMDTSDGTKHEKSSANISVEVEGSGTVGEIVWDNDKAFPTLDYGWHTGRVKITGASADTRVKVGNISSTSVARYFIDDIIISK